MDHLALPPGATVTRPRIRNLCGLSPPYDDGPFREYPVRSGMIPATVSTLSTDFFTQYELNRPVPSWIVDLEKLFQNWLFFGLLHKLLGDSYQATDYLDQEGKFIHTRTLVATLERWKNDRLGLPPEQRAALYADLVACLHVVMSPLSVLIVGRDRYSGFNRDLRHALAATGEVLTVAVDTLVSDTTSTTSWHHIYWDAGLECEIVCRGWCPCTVALSYSQFGRLSTLEYFRHMQ